MNHPRIVWIDYTNHRGERAIRKILPQHLAWESSQWHPEEQWVCVAWCYKSGSPRSFAVKDIHGWFTTEPAP